MKKIVLTLIAMFMALYLIAQPETDMVNSYIAEANGKYPDAIAYMKSAEMTNNKDAFYKLRLGWLHYMSGQYKAAENYYAESYKLENSLEAIEGALGCTYNLGNWDKTIEYCQTILKSYPQNFLALAKLAYSYYVKKNFTNAAIYYKKANSMYPYNLELMGYLLSSQVLSDDRVESKKTYQILKKYSPKNGFVLEYQKLFD